MENRVAWSSQDNSPEKPVDRFGLVHSSSGVPAVVLPVCEKSFYEDYLESITPKHYHYTVKKIVEDYHKWVDEPQYIVFSRTVCGPKSSFFRYIGALAPKRGNVVGAYRVHSRFYDGLVKPLVLMRKKYGPEPDYFEGHKPSVLYFNPKFRSKTLFVTLTYGVDLCSLAKAWRNIGLEINRFLSSLKYYFGRIWIVRCFESFNNGYPHVHLVLYCPDYNFEVSRVHFRRNEETGMSRYMLLPSSEVNNLLHRFWHSLISVEVVERFTKAVMYIGKYVSKNSFIDKTETPDNQRKSELTLALGWHFKKRSFSVSRRIYEDMFQRIVSSGVDLINGLSIIQKSRKQYFQMNLAERVVSGRLEGVVELVGVYNWRSLGKLPLMPVFGLLDKQVKAILPKLSAQKIVSVPVKNHTHTIYGEN